MNPLPVVGAAAAIPNPALKPLEFLAGDWRTTGTHPDLLGQILEGRTLFAWHEGGAFLMMRSEVDHPSIPDGLAFIGSDDGAGTFTMIYFDERGLSRTYEVTVGDRTMTWSRDDAKLSQTLTITADADPDKLVSKGRRAENRGDWIDDLSQVYVRRGTGQGGATP